MWIFLTRVKEVNGFLPVLGVPGEVGLSEAPLGFAEVAGSDLVSRANLRKEERPINQPVSQIIKLISNTLR